MDLCVLGPLTLDGLPVDLPRRDRVVLSVLAVRAGDIVSADQLADAVWPEAVPASWVKVVQGSIVRLRKLLGPAAIETSAHGYRLAMTGDDLDIVRFERLLGRGRELLTLGEPDRAEFHLVQAVALWRGDPLIEVADWGPAEAEVARLVELRRDAEELAVDAGLRLGRQRGLLATARSLVERAPLRERRWALLALAQYQAGQQADALRTLAEVRTVLSRELGLDPGADLAALEHAIRVQDPSLVAAFTPQSRPTCPYRGLMPYDIDDADDFYGRDRDVAACRERLNSVGALTVVGPSGSGKSSLVRAGVAARLQVDGRSVIVVSPGKHPIESVSGVPPPGPSSVLVVDQCEEAVVICDDPAERARFFGFLSEYAERARLVIAVRADRLGDLSGHAGFTRLVERSLYLLDPMTEADLREAIEGPARSAGLRLEPGLVDLLVTEVKGEPGALPLMSHALRATWERREASTLTVAGYRATGGVQGAVAQSAETVYDRVPPERRAALRDLLLRLVAPNPEGDPVRSRLPRRLVAGTQQEELVETLVNARLVTADAGVVELAHEALFRAWPRLHEWLADDAEGQRVLRHLVVAADSWHAMGRPASELYRGTRLANALEWERHKQPELTPIEREFLDAGRILGEEEARAAEFREAQQRRTNRRLRGLLAGVAVLTAGALVLAVLALDQSSEATRQRDAASRERDLAAAAALALASRAAEDPAVALALAAESVRVTTDPLPQGLAALAQARLRLDRGVAQRVGEPLAGPSGGSLTAMAFSPDRRWLALASDTGARLWSVDGREPIPLVGSREPLSTLAFSPDSSTLATGGRDGVELWDLRSAEPAARRLGQDRVVTALSFGPAGLLAVGGADGQTLLWDMREGKQVGTPLGRRGPASVSAVAFDPEGTLVAALDDRATVRIWDLSRSRELVTQFSTGQEASAVAFVDRASWGGTGDGTALATYGSGEQVDLRLWDPRSGHQVARPVLASGMGAVYGMDLHPAGRMVVAGGPDSDLELWIDRDGLEVSHLLGGHSSDVDAVAFSADGALMASADGNGTVLLWAVPPYDGQMASLRAGSRGDGVAFSPAGDLIATAGWRDGAGLIGLWDPADGRLVGTIRERYEVFSVAFNPDASLLASTSDDGRVALWNTATHHRVARHLLRQRYAAATVAVSRQGTLAWVAYGGQVWLWDPDSNESPGRPLAGGSLTYGRSVAFSPDGSTLAVAGEGRDGSLVLWDTATEELLDPPLLSDAPSAGFVVFSADGSRVAAAGLGGRIWLWDHSGDSLIRERAIRAGDEVNSLALSPDGQILVSAGSHGSIRLWNAATGDPVGGTLFVSGSAVLGLAFSPDGRRLAMAGEDGTVRLLDWGPEGACRVAQLYVTQAQVRPYLPPELQPSCGYSS